MNKIEKLEHFIRIDKDRLKDSKERLDDYIKHETQYDEDELKGMISLWETRLESSKLSLEIAKGGASVMRWVKMPEGGDLDYPAHQMLGDDEGLGFIMSNNLTFDDCQHYATFNGSPAIPTPNKEGE